MRFLQWLLSPHALLTGIFISYFSLLYILTFPAQRICADLFLLGLLTCWFSWLVLRRDYKPMKIGTLEAHRILLTTSILLMPLAGYLLVFTGGRFEALVDMRFSLPGFGIVFSLYFVCAFVGACVFAKVRSHFVKLLFSGLVVYSGFVVGGKGFVVPILFGVSLSLSLGLVAVNFRVVMAFLLVAIVSVFATLIDKTDTMVNASTLLLYRASLAADSVNWLSQMSVQDIRHFPITTLTFVLDIFLRFVGARINPHAVGSEIAIMATGDDSGGGPNANLPILAYLINQGDAFFATVFIAVTFGSVLFLIRFARQQAVKGRGSIIYWSIICLSPMFVIDFMVFLQYLFWLIIIGISQSLFSMVAYLSGGYPLVDHKNIELSGIASDVVEAERAS